MSEAALPTLESLGYRVIVRTSLPTVIHGLFVGLCPAGEVPTAANLARMVAESEQALMPAEVALVDPVTDAIVGRFAAPEGVRAVCAWGDARVLWLEGRALVSRAVDGSDRREHCADAVRDGETPTGRLHTDGRLAALMVSDGEGQRRLCVMDLEAGDVRAWLVSEYTDISRMFDAKILLATPSYESSGTLTLVDARTNATQWTLAADLSRAFSVGEVLATDAPLRVLGEGAMAVRVMADDGYDLERGAVDLRTGTLVRASEPSRRLLAFAEAIGAQRAAVWSRSRELEVCRVQDGAPLARFVLSENADDLHALADGRWLSLAGQQLVILGDSPGAVLAGAWLPQTLPMGAWPRCAVGPGWVAVAWASAERCGHTVLPRERAVRALADAQRQPPTLVDAPEWLNEIDDPWATHAVTVDPERLAAILAIAHEEHWNDAAAWERLTARGLVDCTLDRAQWPTESRAGHVLMEGAPRDRVLADLEVRAAWLTLAHDAPMLATVRALSQELLRAMRPFCTELAERVVLRAAAVPVWSFDPDAHQRARDVLLACVEWRNAPSRGYFVELCSLDALWTEAAGMGLRMPSIAPLDLVGRPFAALPSPWAAAIALIRLGMVPVALDREGLVLRLLPIEGEQRAQCPEDWDIPF
ncbi:MAG: hypothetical protein Q8Q09_22455 [Deltaproteobacteria bacterium]|nr:hypothetical protein [Deltaproteobacteria bacterium]